MPSHYGMGGLQQLDSQANPDPWGVVRRRVGFQKQALEALPTFSRMVDWIVDAYKRMGSPPPSSEKMANILKVMQERTSASPLDLSTRGILNPTRPAYEGQRFTRLKTPGDKIPHLREGKIAGEVPFEPRDPCDPYTGPETLCGPDNMSSYTWYDPSGAVVGNNHCVNIGDKICESRYHHVDNNAC